MKNLSPLHAEKPRQLAGAYRQRLRLIDEARLSPETGSGGDRLRNGDQDLESGADGAPARSLQADLSRAGRAKLASPGGHRPRETVGRLAAKAKRR